MSDQPDSNVDVNPWLVAITVSMATFMEVMDTQHRQRRAAAYRRQAGRRPERKHLGADQLSGLQRHHPADQRLAAIGHGPQAVLHDLRGAVHRQLVSVRHCARACAGCCSSACCRASAAADWRPASNRSWPTPSRRNSAGMAFALYGVAVVVAPAIGPTLGGWITDNYTWRWIFFINIPVGILSLFLTHLLVHDSDATPKRNSKHVWKTG